MSELINNSQNRKDKLKALILKLHEGETEESVRNELLLTLSQIPYGEVVEVEQELIAEGLPEEEILDLCDAHSSVLEGRVDLSALKPVPDGHPVHVFRRENEEIRKTTNAIFARLSDIIHGSEENLHEKVLNLRGLFNSLYDVDKLKCWPAGTGYALADWLRTRGHEPVFFTEEENAERRRGLGLPSKD